MYVFGVTAFFVIAFLMTISADLLVEHCPKEMVQVPWPGRPVPFLLWVPAGPVS